ncbi:hypothetical protein F4808DRAFT_157507 [Astrocystis sublimbata]|nr:hypothetical protein F4808DRAFT_157507 [Astrocystis sublimbata]
MSGLCNRESWLLALIADRFCLRNTFSLFVIWCLWTWRLVAVSRGVGRGWLLHVYRETVIRFSFRGLSESRYCTINAKPAVPPSSMCGFALMLAM